MNGPGAGGSDTPVEDPHRPRKHRSRVVRGFYAGLGCLCVGLGTIGAFLPVMPTTIFLIIALWAFARSSDRLHDWLYYHPRFGPFLANWSRYGTISRRAKQVAILTILLSYFATVAMTRNLAVAMIVGAILVAVSTYILTRPENPPP